ncbi:hypothetical protein EJB05_21537 [Eragrostis curvula]|uniref:Cathepsin propeptide inhibitor domain-containing protein n=1 Tax=Eragrostis curvula TaxID=38414 RepID=A0A5J9V3K0_9POAL|nr:hypothetical protein EJB05_21537 [Eragrostis curvula]
MRRSTAALMAAAASLLMLLLVSLASTEKWYEQETLRIFVEWKAKYGMTYKDAGEEECRYAVFKDTRRQVERNNAIDGRAVFGLNGLSALAQEEVFLGARFREGEDAYEEETRRMFLGWKAKHGKTYKDAGEEDCRYKLFKGNRRRLIGSLNAAAAAGGTAYGLNQFGDLTYEEVRASCYNPEMKGKLLSARCHAATADLPDTVPGRLISDLVCRCIAIELKQSTESEGEAHMWI